MDRSRGGTTFRKGWLTTGALLTGLVFLLAGCGRRTIPQDTLNPAGPQALKEASLFWIVFIIAAVVFFLVEGLLVVALVRFRSRPGRGSPVQVHGNRRLEIGWTVAPAMLLLIVAIITVPAIFSVAAKPAGALPITVTGHQWWWEVQYPGMNVTTANELHIPTGKPIYITLRSVDVIHSFWVPRLAGKQDLEPGRINHVKMEAPQPGTYLGQCAEFCGASHANMRLRVIAEPQAQFQSWVAAESEAAAQAPPGTLAAQGQQFFMNGVCVGCHTVKGLPNAAGIVGPNLTHFASRTTFAGATYPNAPADLGAWLHDPQALKPGNDMVIPRLPQDEINALVAYLETLK